MCTPTSTSDINTASSMNVLKIKRSKAMIAPPVVPKKNNNKAVRFNHNVCINIISAHQNYSLEERILVWYTNEDYRSFKNKNNNRRRRRSTNLRKRSTVIKNDGNETNNVLNNEQLSVIQCGEHGFRNLNETKNRLGSRKKHRLFTAANDRWSASPRNNGSNTVPIKPMRRN